MHPFAVEDVHPMTFPRANGSANDAAQRMHFLRTVAELLSSDAPIAELWPLCSAPIAALLDAERMLVALLDGTGEQIVFDSSLGERPPDARVPAGSIAADVLARGETVARSDGDAVSVGQFHQQSEPLQQHDASKRTASVGHRDDFTGCE